VTVFLALVARDLRLALRHGTDTLAAVLFFAVAASLFPFAVGPAPETLARIAPGVVWVTALLAALLPLDRIFAAEAEDGSLDLLATAPVPLEAVVAMKAAAHWLTTGLPLTLAAPALGLLLNLPGPGFGWLALSLLVGTPALSVIGSFGAGLTVGLKRGGLLLSLLVLPLYVPTLIFGAEVARRGAAGFDAMTPLLLQGAITLGAIAVLPFAAAAAIRINLR
jgi:heme exporter protein B